MREQTTDNRQPATGNRSSRPLQRACRSFGRDEGCPAEWPGEVNFDFRQGGDMEFRAGPRRVKATRAHLLVARDRRAPSLTVVAGTGYLSHDKGGETIILRSGDTIGLE